VIKGLANLEFFEKQSWHAYLVGGMAGLTIVPASCTSLQGEA
jgi:hypothetical protein